MAEIEAVHPSLSKKTRTDEEKVKEPSTSIFDYDHDDDDDDDDVHVPLTEESQRLISEFRERHDKSGGFDVPDVPPSLHGRALPSIWREDPISEDLINVVNTAIRHHKKKKKKNEVQMMDLVLLEILRAFIEYRGTFQYYITFKARDSSGAVRTYETLIYPMFSDENVVLEIFRVKPYSDIEYPGDNKAESSKGSV